MVVVLFWKECQECFGLTASCRSFPMCLFYSRLAFEMQPSQLDTAAWRANVERYDKSLYDCDLGELLCLELSVPSAFFSLFCFLLTSLGPRLGNSPVQSIVQCLARKDGTDDFYQLKVSTLWFGSHMVMMLLTISTCHPSDSNSKCLKYCPLVIRFPKSDLNTITKVLPCDFENVPSRMASDKQKTLCISLFAWTFDLPQ